ncbi:hypothetical protein KBD61_04415 [Patescibacteria group bacterium]|nr:hypothetical protein [Patescibacteria group bacterium]MBP9710238.1 hypothetical protein [Patescibacteria group bacterium]
MNVLQKNIGRPLFDGKDESLVLQKLDEAFMLGSTDVEACIYADISPSALYEYQKKNKPFLERKEALKNMPTLRAKKAIVDRLSEDTELAKWWLVRRARLEFSEKSAFPF